LMEQSRQWQAVESMAALLPFALAILQTLATQAPGTSSETQQPAVKPEDMCTIEGVVLKAATGDPLKKAVLTLTKEEGRNQPKNATSDASGRFQLKDIEPGRYHLSAARNGYVTQEYGQRATHGSGTILTLTSGQKIKDISFRLIPAAVIAGHVYDEDGEPVVEAEVQALRFQYEKGQRKLTLFHMVRTNDLGEYRLYGLAPGQYYVNASYNPHRFGREGLEAGYAAVYYPGSADPNRASVLDLHAGDELPGIDFTLVQVKTFNVKGRVYDAVNSRPGIHTMVLLEPRNAEVRTWTITSQNSVQDPQGAFELRGVVPGSYYVLAINTEGDKQYTAREAIEVSDSDVEGVSLVIGPGIDLKGRIRVEGNAALDPSVLNIWLQPREEGMHIAGGRPSIKPDGTFAISNVGDGDYQFEMWGLPEDFYLKTARLGGSDVLASDLSVNRKQPPGALDVVLSPNGGRIDGRVLKEDKPFSGATVVLVPEEGRRKEERLYESTSTDQDGQFSIRGIAPGDYTLFAWETIEHGAYMDPDFLRPYKDRGKPIHVDEGNKLNSQLELIPANESEGAKN
jgi:Carboxypeptidase regulatory-like domain